MPAGAASCFRLQKLGGVAVDMEDHVTGQIADGRARMGGGVVEEQEVLLQRPLGPLSNLVLPRKRALCDVTSTTT